MRSVITSKGDLVCGHLEEDGPGLKSLEAINKSLLMKLLWKVQTGEAEWFRFTSAKFKDINGEWIKYH